MTIIFYSTVAQSILKMDNALKAKMTKKFKICYAMAMERKLRFGNIQYCIIWKLTMVLIWVLRMKPNIQLRTLHITLLWHNVTIRKLVKGLKGK